MKFSVIFLTLCVTLAKAGILVKREIEAKPEIDQEDSER